MSKADEIRALREAQAERRINPPARIDKHARTVEKKLPPMVHPKGEPVVGASLAYVPALKPVEPKGRGKHQRRTKRFEEKPSVADLQAKADSVVPASHPECKRCEWNREQVRDRVARMRKRRAK